MESDAFDSLKRKIEAYSGWYHQIEVAPGLVTPGGNNSKMYLGMLDTLGLPANCQGKRVLDLGARDGFYSFEMERRGAQVLAVDYALPTSTGFSIASEILKSKVPYQVDNIYSLSAEKYGTFDIILFLGLIYHLRNPMLALDIIRSLCKPNALVFVESEIISDRISRWKERIRFLLQKGLGKKRIPDATTWRFLPIGTLNNDGTNCWLPSLKGLQAAVEAAEFQTRPGITVGPRGIIAAQAVSDPQKSRFRKLDISVGEY